MKVENEFGCAPEIWRKFNEVERNLYNDFRTDFGYTKVSLYPAKVEKSISAEDKETLEHNLAVTAVWSLQGHMKSAHVVGVITATGKSRISVNS